MKIFALIILLLIGAVLSDSLFFSTDWRSARRDSAGLAPQTDDAVVQIYAARAINWRGWFAVHTWVATKEKGAKNYTIYQVMGWRLYQSGKSLLIHEDIPDRYWFGAKPSVVETLTGAQAEAAIPKIKAAANSYAYANAYRLWPGPNSNTFVSHIIRNVPELSVELPPNAIGRDWIETGKVFARSETGTGYQISLLGALGITVGKAEGLEINILGLTFGVDILHPALKLPFIGRIGRTDGPV